MPDASRSRFARSDLGGSDRVGAILHTERSPQISGPPPLLRGLDADQVALVMSEGSRKVVYRGATIFSQGAPHDGIYLIESGRVRVFYTSPAGREVTLAYWHPGNFVGGPEVFGQSLHVWSGVAVTDCTILHLRASVLRSLIGRIPALGIGVIEGLSFKGKCYSAMAQMLGTRSVAQRLAHLLLHLADLYGIETGDVVVIEADFTDTDLAHLVGATRQWVNMQIKRLTQQGLLGRSDGSVSIRDAAKLRRLCDAALDVDEA